MKPIEVIKVTEVYRSELKQLFIVSKKANLKEHQRYYERVDAIESVLYALGFSKDDLRIVIDEVDEQVSKLLERVA